MHSMACPLAVRRHTNAKTLSEISARVSTQETSQSSRTGWQSSAAAASSSSDSASSTGAAGTTMLHGQRSHRVSTVAAAAGGPSSSSPLSTTTTSEYTTSDDNVIERMIEFKAQTSKLPRVDKSIRIADALQSAQTIVVCGPPGWGKHSLVRAMTQMISGNRDYFDTCSISTEKDHPHKWNRHAVIHLDLQQSASISAETGATCMETILNSFMHKAAREVGVNLNTSTLARSIEKLFTELASRGHTGINKPALIIENYDAPLTAALRQDNGAVTQTVRDIHHSLQRFLQLLTDQKNGTSWTIISGTVPFETLDPLLSNTSTTSIGLHSSTQQQQQQQQQQLCDDDALEVGTSLLGFTWEEITHTYAVQLQEMCAHYNISPKELERRLSTLYGNYSFNGTNKLFNPYDIRHVFQHMKLQPYWASQCHRGWLDRVFDMPQIAASEWLVNSYDASELDALIRFDELENPSPSSTLPLALLRYYGYLTIDHYTHKAWAAPRIALRVPNISIQETVDKDIAHALCGGCPHSTVNGPEHGDDVTDLLKHDDIIGYLHRMQSHCPHAFLFRNLEDSESWTTDQIAAEICTRICGVARLLNSTPSQPITSKHQDSSRLIESPSYHNILLVHVLHEGDFVSAAVESGSDAEEAHADAAVGLKAAAHQLVDYDAAKCLRSDVHHRYQALATSDKPSRVISAVYTEKGSLITTRAHPFVFKHDELMY
jgi:Predicted AAA-ATPase